ncbi:acyltransferase [Paraburkholderia sp. J67]|uniref:acyltransferase family protein n=1 Tax=Paraburkholderia sp. J67 TaxID=2805435 RepID=UPI002ABE106D|nr:acyltransferase [Paraburkholderia sp. J67]
MGPGLFRLLLASVVVIFHYSSLSLGHAAVYLFFVLSGYWVCQMWEHKYSRTRHPYLTFVLSRAWRIAPVFLLCSALACAMVWVQVSQLPHTAPAQSAPLDHVFWALLPSLVLLGYNSSWFTPLLPAWSLDIEMQYYLVAPLVLAALKRKPAIVFVLTLATGAVFSALHGHPTLATSIPCFVAGMYAARYPDLANGKRYVIASAAATVAVIATPLLIPELRSLLLGGTHPGPLYRYNELLNVIVTLTCLPFALGTVRNRSGKADQLMADLSYSLYLFHWIPHQLVALYLPGLAQAPRIERALGVCAVIAVTYALSILITLYVDRPANRARARFVRNRLITDRAARTGTSPSPVMGLPRDALAASLDSARR